MKQMLAICLVFLSVITCEKQHTATLEDLKPWKLDDKYFKANLRYLYFVSESCEIPRTNETFDTIQKMYNLPLDAKDCHDGVYRAATPPDPYDYRHVITLTIRNEKIVNVDYDEVHLDGHGKQSDTLYCKEMSVAGTTPAIAYPIMEKQLVDNQNIMQVDGVTGASYSRFRFRYAAMMALVSARLSEPNNE